MWPTTLGGSTAGKVVMKTVIATALDEEPLRALRVQNQRSRPNLGP